MKLLKQHYHINEVVDILNQQDLTINSKRDILDLIFDGDLEVRVKINGANLIPVLGYNVQASPIIYGLEWFKASVREVFINMDNYSPLSSYRRKELLCEYKKIVKSTKYFTSDFLDRESSLTSHKYFPVIQTKGKTRLLQHEDISYQDIRSFFSNSKSIELNKPPLINVSIPISVTPKHGFFDLPLDFLERVEPQNLEGYKRTFQTRNVNEIKQLLLSQHFQCTYNGNDYFLVGIDRNKYLLQFSLDQTTIGNSIINDELYITSASIKSWSGYTI